MARSTFFIVKYWWDFVDFDGSFQVNSKYKQSVKVLPMDDITVKRMWRFKRKVLLYV